MVVAGAAEQGDQELISAIEVVLADVLRGVDESVEVVEGGELGSPLPVGLSLR